MGVVSGVVRAEDGAPVSGATVRVQTTTHSTTTGKDGRFSLSVSEPWQQRQLTAWASGYIIGGPVPFRPGDTDVELELQPHATADNPDYQWQSSLRRPGEGEDLGCANCHSAAGSELTHSLPFDEWALGSAPSSPQTRGVHDIDRRLSKIREYVAKYAYSPRTPDERLTPDELRQFEDLRTDLQRLRISFDEFITSYRHSNKAR